LARAAAKVSIRWGVAIAGVACAAALACALAWHPVAPQRIKPVKGAERIGAAECHDCHEKVEDHPKIAAYHADCEACHGGGSLHAESQEPEDIRFPSTGDCLACHESGRDTHLEWGTGEHARAGLLCTDCHSGHATTDHHLREPRGNALTPRSAAPGGLSHARLESRVCVDCHDDVAARFVYPSHHPVREGMLDCTSCHDPHEDSRVHVGDANQRCTTCHQDYAGPWVYEHEPVVEDCTECHDPHGAPADALLSTPQPVVCLTCHSLADLWHHNTSGTGIPGNTGATTDFPAPGSGAAIKPLEARTFLRDCTNCHGAVHGSYTDETLQH
jgi:predicted CXXCH cytochrome family protein